MFMLRVIFREVGVLMETLTAQVFLQMLSAAARNLDAEKERVNALNVFPVPDGDTGTNMALTLNAALAEAKKANGNHLGEVAEMAAKGALMGARGNSGVILSQFFRGLSEGLKGLKDAGPENTVKALESATNYAYKAVMKPVEGTMLTVGRAGAEAAREAMERGYELMRVLMAAYEGAEEALKQTPKLLRVLRDAKVVDAGGEGLVVAAQGSLGVLRNGVFNLPISLVTEESIVEVSNNRSSASEVTGTTFVAKEMNVNTASEMLSGKESENGKITVSDITFKYCTEFLIQGRQLFAESVKSLLQPLGDCLLVVGDESLLKVHIHTNHPGVVLELCNSHGELNKIQVNNMVLQNQDAANGQQEDHSEDEDDQTPLLKTGVVAVAQGEGFISIFKDLGVHSIIPGGQSMNPSTQEILSAIEAVNSDTVILFPNNKNVILSARQAASLSKKKVYTLPTKSMPAAVSLLMLLNEEMPAEDLVKQMEEALEQVKVGEITQAVRNAKIDGIQVKQGEYIGICEGRILSKGEDSVFVLEEVLKSIPLEKAEVITLYSGKDVTEEQASSAKNFIQSRYPDVEVQWYVGGQPLYHYLFSVE
jgi:DAK2 domain fusion protein YloV